MTACARAVPEERQSEMLGVVSAAGSLANRLGRRDISEAHPPGLLYILRAVVFFAYFTTPSTPIALRKSRQQTAYGRMRTARSSRN